MMFQGVLEVVLGNILRFFQGCPRNVLKMVYGCFMDVSGDFQVCLSVF